MASLEPNEIKVKETSPLIQKEHHPEDTEGEGAENGPPSNGSGGEYGSISSHSDSCCKQITQYTDSRRKQVTKYTETCRKQVKKYTKPYWKHIIFGIPIVLLCGGFRAVCSVIRWLAIHECQTTNNATTNNATSNSTQDGYFKFTAALYGVFGILQAFAALVIVINIKYSFVKETWKKTEFKDLKCLPGVMLLLILIPWSFAICATGLLYDLQLDNCHYTHWYQKPAVYAYHILVLITTIFISIVLFGLVFATVCVYCIWNDFVPVPEEYYKGDFDSTRASIFYTYVCYKYRTKGKEVIPFTSTFRSWFVLQWFTYFLGIFIDLTYVLRPWILGGNVDKSVKIYKEHKLEYTYISLFIVYDIIVFIVPFACGLIMNKYHDQYYNKLVKDDIDEDFRDKPIEEKQNCGLWYASKTAVLKVQKVQEFDFTPSILGVDIPLTNPGYILSILIAMVTLILGFLVDPLDQSM